MCDEERENTCAMEKEKRRINTKIEVLENDIIVVGSKIDDMELALAACTIEDKNYFQQRMLSLQQEKSSLAQEKSSLAQQELLLLKSQGKFYTYVLTFLHS